MSLGFPEYGCQIAPDKSLVSFNPANPETKTNVCKDDCKSALPVWFDPITEHCFMRHVIDFTYCGFAIHVGNLDISIDTTRKVDMRKSRVFGSGRSLSSLCILVQILRMLFP